MVFRFARPDSKMVSDECGKEGQRMFRWGIYWDMIKCYHKYHIWTNQYKKEKFWTLSKEERDELGEKYKKRNKEADMIGIMHG